MSVAIEKKLGRLEKEIRKLRRELAPARETVGQAPFKALEVRSGQTSWFGIDIGAVREVVPMIWCDPLPESPSWVVGTFRFGDEILPLIDLTARLDGQSCRIDPSRTVLVLEKDFHAALLVDGVRNLVDVEPSRIDTSRAELSETPFLICTIFSGEHEQLRILSPRRIASELIEGTPLHDLSCDDI